MLALGPGLRRGFLLSYDMVFVPSEPFRAALPGLAPPRAVPSDLVIATASRVLPADIVQKVVLLAIFVLACAGVTALLEETPLLARLAGGVFYAWNPYVGERLIIGQWALLLGYAGLPWVLRAVLKPDLGTWRGAARLTLAMLPAIIGGFAAMSITALVVIPAVFFRGVNTNPAAATRSAVMSTGRATVPIAVLTVGCLPWFIPAVMHHVYADPAGVAAFAARADTPSGSVGSLVMLGGAWNAGTVPRGYGGGWSTVWLAVVLAGLVGYALLSMPRLVCGLSSKVRQDQLMIGRRLSGRRLAGQTLDGRSLDGQALDGRSLDGRLGWHGGSRRPFGTATAAAGGLGQTNAAAGGPGQSNAAVARWRSRFPGLGIGAVVGLGIACIGVTGAGRAVLRDAIGGFPGLALLRDAQQFVAPLALVEACGLGHAVAWAAYQCRYDKRTKSFTGGGNPAATMLGVFAIVAPLALLPGLAWGAGGRLRPAWYPASWLAAARVIDASPESGAALLLPWASYRTPVWNHGEVLLDPWPRLVARPVIWNDGTRVGDVTLAPDDPRARRLDALITGTGPLTAALRAAGVRFVIDDPDAPGEPAQPRLPGAAKIIDQPGLTVYRLPG